MATITGTHVNFVKVPTMAKFNDIATKADGTIYFIVDEKKIHLDGVMYGFNDTDIDLTPYFKRDGSVSMDGTLNMKNNNIENMYQIMSGAKGNEANEADKLEFNDGGIGMFLVGENGETLTYIQFDPNGIQMSGEYFLGIDGLTPFDDLVLWNTENDNQAASIGTLKNLVLNKRGVANGYASLGTDGKVPSTQLPSYVDDVEEYNDKASFPEEGESGKLYIDLSNNYVWRWSGSAYVNVSDGNAHLVLGTTSSTAYYGDKGKEAYDHSQLTSGNPHGVTKANVGLGSVQNYGLATKAQAEAGTSNAVYMTPQRTKEAIEKLAPELSWTVVV